MQLKTYFMMLALGICGAVMQSCDDDDDNLKSCGLRFLKNIRDPFRNGKPGVIIILLISGTKVTKPKLGLLPMLFG